MTLTGNADPHPQAVPVVALAKTPATAPARGPATPPVGGLAGELAAVLGEVLGRQRVPLDGHFFDDVGADSMTMALFCARVRKRADLPAVSIKQVYLHPTPRSLAAALAGTRPEPAPAAPPAQQPAPQAQARVHGPGEETPPPGARWFVLCGVLQVLVFLAYWYAVALVGIEGLAWAYAAEGWAATYRRLVVFGAVSFAALAALPVLAKWLLVGRWQAGRIPLWGPRYVRFWFVRMLVRANPLVLFTGSPLYPLYLRALGADIGRRVAVFSRNVPVCTDLLTIGDDAVIRKDSSFACYRAHAGHLETGPVTIGAGAFVGEATVLDVGTSLGDGAQLGHSSALHAGQAVPAHEGRAGSPATEPGTVDWRAVPPARCGPVRRLLYPAGQQLAALLLYVPLAIAGIRLLFTEVFGHVPALLGDPGALAGPSFYADAAVLSAVLFAGGALTGLAVVLTVPRLLNKALEPNRPYRLYGIHYTLHRAITRLTNVEFFTHLFGDSSYVVPYLRALGYDLSDVEQTGSNFGLEVRHDNPYLTSVGTGTMVADGLSVINTDYSSTSFRLSRAAIGAHTFVGNYVAYPAQARTGDDCLLATKVQVPVAGGHRQGTGLLGSPSFPIPRSVQRDARFDHLRHGATLRRRLAAKNAHNAATIGLYLLAQWAHLYGITLIASAAIACYPAAGALAIELAAVASLAFSIGFLALVERAATSFRPLRPRYCSIYDPYFWWHERYWKLSTQPPGVLDGTPFKGLAWRLLGAKAGRRIFDDGCLVMDKTMVAIGDDAVLNAGSVIQPHSQEDGSFKSDRIGIGARCTLGVGALVHYGATLGDDATLAADTFLMKGEDVPPHARWGGNPAGDLRPLPAAVGRTETPVETRMTTQPERITAQPDEPAPEGQVPGPAPLPAPAPEPEPERPGAQRQSAPDPGPPGPAGDPQGPAAEPERTAVSPVPEHEPPTATVPPAAGNEPPGAPPAGGAVTRIPRWTREPAGGHGAFDAAAGPAGGVAAYEVPVPGELVGRLAALADEAGVTLGSLLLAAHAKVLAALTGEPDVVTGYAAAPGGPALPCPLTTSPPTWRALLEHTRSAEAALLTPGTPTPPPGAPPAGALPYGARPGPAARLPGDETHPDPADGFPPYETEFDPAPQPAAAEPAGLAVTTVLRVEFPQPAPGRRSLRLRYRTDVIDAEHAARIAGYHLAALARLAAGPDAEHAAQSLLSAAEVRHQLDDLAGPRRPLPDRRAHELFEERVRAHPDAVAVVHGPRRWTYAQLNAHANRLARALLARGLGPEGVVAVVAERTLDWAAAVLAVFKAGGVYLSVEPHFPAERVAAMLARADCRLVLTEPAGRAVLDRALAQPPLRAAGPEVVGVDVAYGEGHPGDDPGVAVAAGQLAYVYFTSGSTGTPKGAMCEHAGMLNHLYAKIEDLRIAQGQVVAQTAPQCFDISLWQLLAGLLAGGRTLLVEQDVILDVPRFLDVLAAERVAVLQVVPSYLDAVLAHLERHPRALPDLGHVSVTGEPLKPDLARRWFAALPGVRLVNAYGLTETSDDTNHDVMERAPERVLLGRPVRNVHVYVVDDHLAPVPLGAPGQIVFSGVCVGRGYVNDAERTRASYLADPHRPGHRLYRGGDVGRWHPDGRLEFLGRHDGQVKVAGFRIELGEVENALSRVPGIRDCAVVVADRPGHGKRLVAFYTAPRAFARGELRDALSASLPAYMIPAAFHHREALPLTANGKTDKKALTKLATEPAPGSAAAAAHEAAPAAGISTHGNPPGERSDAVPHGRPRRGDDADGTRTIPAARSDAVLPAGVPHSRPTPSTHTDDAHGERSDAAPYAHPRRGDGTTPAARSDAVPSADHRRDGIPPGGDTPDAVAHRPGSDAPNTPRAPGALLSPAERELVAAWAQVLGVDADRIGRGDDFFALGGTSLLAVKLAVALDRRLSLQDFARHPVLADLARLLSERTRLMPTPPPASPLAVDRRPGAPPVLHVAPGTDPAAWAARHRDGVRAAVTEHGALLVRGLGLHDAAGTRAVFARLADGLMTETEPFAPRRYHGGGVYSSVPWPAAQPMCMHHELSYALTPPGLMLFACTATPTPTPAAPSGGGEIGVADAAAVLDALPARLVARFEREGWLLTRTYGQDIGASVEEAFGTADPDAVERYCRDHAIEATWLPGGILRTRQRRSAVVRHPVTGRRCWFNQVAFLSEWTMDPEVRAYLLEAAGPGQLPFRTAYGNGEPLGADVVDLINEVYEDATARAPLHAGDLLLVDNVRCAHDRRPYEGPREVLVGLADPVRPEPVHTHPLHLATAPAEGTAR
ncbi:amino acid adenylation domain-containing protein [Streptomyces sp. WMMC500]|uniref:Pls/PosA family non-ribosomal peptide synthetase n=1 Tax=Streptomyces sp. WMMC500 TaxID=3015154 RepID=UPI00248C2647|nr:Pls/PosA family non-ribosomal peptide synthetase [Streptomyces sp. WMMC500]WBB61010.1 amino acid adenylation domain-containing protein [Streptomyces sp. WMMC500]